MKVAIYGCGQLARLMALAGQPFNIQFSFIAEPDESITCVKGLGKVVRLSEELNAETLYARLEKPNVITVEREDVSITWLKQLEQFCQVFPSPDIIRITQNRFEEKSMLNSLGIPTTKFHMATSLTEVKTAIMALGFPVFVKSCEQGYDGKGQWLLKTEHCLQSLPEINENQPLIVEAGIDYLMEVSLIGVRNPQGETAFYPITENKHKSGKLLASFAPCEKLAPALEKKIRNYMETILTTFDYVGCLAIEAFVLDNEILVNELAPRVHNSGHWTIEGSTTSQFENHIRAITGESLGNTKAPHYSGMVNVIGHDKIPPLTEKCKSYLHMYKKENRPGRKMGHVTFSDTNPLKIKTEVTDFIHRIYPESRKSNTDPVTFETTA